MIEPGWYDDEQDPALSRWHDGTAWTVFVVVKEEWAEEPPPPAAFWAQPGLSLDDVQPVAEPVATTSPGRRFAPAPSVDEEAAPRRWSPPRSGDASWVRPEPPVRVVTPPRARVLLPVVGALLVLAVVLRVFVVDGDDGGDPSLVGLPTYVADWTATDGSAYRMTVVPSPRSGPGGSRAGCVGPASAGTVNVRASVQVENRSAGPVGHPDVSFTAVRLDGGDGSDAEDVAHPVEVAPLADGASCADGAARIGPEGRGPLAPGASATFEVVVGGLDDPVASDEVLVVRFRRGQPAEGELASTADLVVPLGSRAG